MAEEEVDRMFETKSAHKLIRDCIGIFGESPAGFERRHSKTYRWWNLCSYPTVKSLLQRFKMIGVTIVIFFALFMGSALYWDGMSEMILWGAGIVLVVVRIERLSGPSDMRHLTVCTVPGLR